MVKILSTLLNCSERDMITDLEKGDIGETCSKVVFTEIIIELNVKFSFFLNQKLVRKKVH